MPLSAAEKMKRYRERIKSDPQRYEQVKSKERARWHHRCATGEIKTIKGMNAREKRARRRGWQADSIERSIKKQ